MILALMACGPDHTLVRWERDAAVMERDAGLLRGEATRAPVIWQPPRDKPDIVMIVLDTVRADHLGMYGYDRGTSPRLDVWAAGARVYDHMMADAPWTLPSHASLFTGRWPRAHGAHGTGPLPAGEVQHYAAPLAPDTVTLARALYEGGYTTAGIAANQAYLDERWGLSRGFGTWLCATLPTDARRTPYPTGDRVTALAQAWLQRPSDAPRFLFLNYMDAHAPWIPREGYVRDPTRIDRRVLPFADAWEDIGGDLLSGEGVPEATRAAWVEAYDSELRFLDAQVGTLLDALPSLGIGPEDWVFLLSDHGEYLGEHALVLHSREVYQPVLHVPLIIRGPGVVSGRDPTPVQHHDVPALVLAAAGLPPLPDSTATGELQVAEQYGSTRHDRATATMAARFDRIRRAFRRGDHKLILGSDGSMEVYDLAADPGEAHDLVPDRPDWLEPLITLAQAWEAATPVAPVLSEGAGGNKEKLEALGYVE